MASCSVPQEWRGAGHPNEHVGIVENPGATAKPYDLALREFEHKSISSQWDRERFCTGP